MCAWFRHDAFLYMPATVFPSAAYSGTVMSFHHYGKRKMKPFLIPRKKKKSLLCPVLDSSVTVCYNCVHLQTPSKKRKPIRDREESSVTEIQLKYGCNPHQKPAKIFMRDGGILPVSVINGKPGYINFLDAFNAWQLARELKASTGLPSAASFKHVSPAGAAVSAPLSDTEKQMYFVPGGEEPSPIACAYIRARGADRLCSYGDWVALSDTCDASTAKYLRQEVSDGIIAPDYTREALDILREKKKGSYNIVQIDKDYIPAPVEYKDVFGITFEQGRNDAVIDRTLLTNPVTRNREISMQTERDMLIALITLKYTQSNSVCYVLVPDSRAAFTVRALPVRKPITGICVNIPRY